MPWSLISTVSGTAVCFLKLIMFVSFLGTFSFQDVWWSNYSQNDPFLQWIHSKNMSEVLEGLSVEWTVFKAELFGFCSQKIAPNDLLCLLAYLRREVESSSKEEALQSKTNWVRICFGIDFNTNNHVTTSLSSSSGNDSTHLEIMYLHLEKICSIVSSPLKSDIDSFMKNINRRAFRFDKCSLFVGLILFFWKFIFSYGKWKWVGNNVYLKCSKYFQLKFCHFQICALTFQRSLCFLS